MPAPRVHRRERVEQLRPGTAGAGDRDRCPGPASESIRYCGVMRRDRVADAGRGVQPERRRRLAAAAERDQQVAGHLALREAGLRRQRAVDVQVQLRLVEHLVHAQVGEAGHLREPVAAASPRTVGWPRGCGPTTWTSIGAGRPKFRICVTMSAGRKVNRTPGNRFGSSRRSSRTYSAVGAVTLVRATPGCRRPPGRSAPRSCTAG